jgi:hypothetical protein
MGQVLHGFATTTVRRGIARLFDNGFCNWQGVQRLSTLAAHSACCGPRSWLRQSGNSVPTPDAGQRIEASGEVDLMEGDDASRPDKARSCAEEIDGIGLMYQDVSTSAC